MMNCISLQKLGINKSGIISKIDGNPDITDRLADMGFIEGACVCAEFVSPFGDPVAFRIRNTVVAVRKKDCAKIMVKELPYENQK
ncbi:MAG: ferrous iron transport protein A [Ruminococcus sp.]|nr:ferrous iron transport protein A [Ruminococcus sp.]